MGSSLILACQVLSVRDSRRGRNHPVAMGSEFQGGCHGVGQGRIKPTVSDRRTWSRSSPGRQYGIRKTSILVAASSTPRRRNGSLARYAVQMVGHRNVSLDNGTPLACVNAQAVCRTRTNAEPRSSRQARVGSVQGLGIRGATSVTHLGAPTQGNQGLTSWIGAFSISRPSPMAPLTATPKA